MARSLELLPDEPRFATHRQEYSNKLVKMAKTLRKIQVSVFTIIVAFALKTQNQPISRVLMDAGQHLFSTFLDILVRF